jgi:hypothetical protein
MRRTSRWAATLALAILLAPLSACETRSLTLRIEGFGDGRVDGIWLWRLSEESGRFERTCRIELGDPFLAGEVEKVSYAQICGDEGGGLPLEATIERSEDDPDVIVIDLWYFRWDAPGSFKASLFTSEGESALSPVPVTL